MICLTLTHKTLEDWRRTTDRYDGYYQCIEMRLDLLDRIDPEEVRTFANQLRCPIILTVRRASDGGRYTGNESARLALIALLLDSARFRYVDLEYDLGAAARSVEEVAQRTGTTVIRSVHDFAGIPDDIVRTLDALAEDETSIPKLAVTPTGSQDLLALLRAYGACRGRFRHGYILLGMGRFGVPTRILAPALGGLLTFASAQGAEAAPGHVDPTTLVDVYKLPTLGSSTRVFGVIGNPVLHSKSPHYHNPRFCADAADAVYVPFPTDDVETFFEIVDELPVEGFSVTIPHKEAVLAYLTSHGAQVDESAKAAGSCNTVVRRGAGFFGTTTDVPGFLAPLRDVFGSKGLSGLRATVIGAGGAARAVVYALASAGVSVLILNRTLVRAERLAQEMTEMVAGAIRPAGDPLRRTTGRQALDPLGGGVTISAAPLTEDGLDGVDGYRDLLVQTTGIGMEPNTDAEPAPGLELRGDEVVYDIIYTPEVTRFLARARDAGCRTITGRAMFDGQAAEQYRLFTERLAELS